MGCLQSTEVRQERELNQKINRQIHEDGVREKTSRVIKLLLLGTGESGKSTVLKQIRIIHGGGYSREDRLATRDVVFSNAVQSMKIIVEVMGNFGIPVADQNGVGKHYDYMREIRYQVETDTFPNELKNAIKALWADSGVQMCFSRSREFQLNDSAKYYFDAIERIGAAEYIPTDEDILRSRVKTTGIVESNFNVEGQNYKIFDVGGQRSERRKWIHCFENVTALFFIVAISEYDQKLVEDETTNRVKEAISLFSSISHNRWFENTSIILFLNKIDIFNCKVQKSAIEAHFEEFVRDESKPLEEDGFDFFKALFEAEFLFKRPEDEAGAQRPHASAAGGGAGCNAGACGGVGGGGDEQPGAGGPSKRHKELFTYSTCATDTNQMKNIISSVNLIIIQANLEDCGLL